MKQDRKGDVYCGFCLSIYKDMTERGVWILFSQKTGVAGSLQNMLARYSDSLPATIRISPLLGI